MSNQQNSKKFIFKKDRHLAITPTFRGAFLDVFKAVSFKDPDTGVEGKPEFKVTMLFESMDAIKAEQKNGLSLARAIQNAKVDFWGADPKKWPKMDYPTFKEGSKQISQKTGEVYDGFEGTIVASAKTGEKYPPKITCANGAPANDTTIYAGAYYRAVITVKPYRFAGKYGIKLYLTQITKVKDGERFGGFSEVGFDDEGIDDAMDTGSLESDSSEDFDADF